MEQKSNKELAIETTLEYIKLWNIADHTCAITTDEFIDILNKIYSTICSFDKD